ncbi:TonB-dependent receptor [Ravibacter arvi]|uniref:TonB-dependent receptor n=1 Tax=Ravibacter arvi TaxID=2051041 RepID=A0ABP8M748_9BACT
MRITHVGYKHLSISFLLRPNDGPAKFELTPEAVHLTEVRIAAPFYKKGSQLLPTDVLNADELRQKNKSTIANALEDLPGIKAINTGVGIAKPVIRGMSHNRIIVNNQGIKQEGQQWGSDHGLEIDSFEPGRIEIVKGPASLRYGSDGLGGVINLYPPPIPQDSSFKATLNTLYNSNNHLFGVSAMVQGAQNGRFYRVRLSGQDFGDYAVPATEFTYNSYVLPIYNNRLKNTAGRERNFSVMTGIKKKWGSSDITVSNFHQKAALFVGAIGVPRSRQLTPDGNNRNIATPFQQTNHFKVASTTRLLHGRNWTEIDAAYQFNARQEHSDGHGRLAQGTLAHGLDLHTLSANIRYFQHKKNESRIWGLQLEGQQNSRRGFEYLLPAYRKFSSGFYALTEWSAGDAFLVSGGLRADYSFIHIDATSEPIYKDNQVVRYYERNPQIRKDFANLSGSLGFTFQPLEDFGLKANFGSSFRMPAANELAINGVHHGTFRHEMGNSALKTERGFQLDLSTDLRVERLKTTIALFGAYYKNYIYLAPTAVFSSSLDPDAFPEGGQVYQFQQNNAIYGGGELSLDYQPTRFLQFRSALEYVYNLNLDSRLPLPFTPPPSVFSEIFYTTAIGGDTFSHLKLGVNLRNVGTQNRTDRNERPTGGYHLLGASVGTIFKIGKLSGNLNATARNLTNQLYMNHLSRYRLLNLPEPAQNYSVSLSFNFATL